MTFIRLFLLTASLTLVCLSQTRPTSAVPETGLNNLPAQRIQPNDLVAISVYDAPEMTRTVRVGPDGTIRLPMVKQHIRAQGVMPAELEAAIASELQNEQLVLDPVVTVTIVEYDSHPISVAGAVKTPATFQATTPVTLLEALTRAGGLMPNAGLEILVSVTKQNPGQDKPALLTRRIPVHGLIDEADPELNITLYGGEEVRVPEMGKVFVVGMVKKPGAFPIQDGSETTVLQMLALAEGLQGVNSDEAFIYRREAHGSKNEISVNIKKLLTRKTPDVPLMANDILYIPENTTKKLGMAILEKVLLFGTSAGATALAYGLIH